MRIAFRADSGYAIGAGHIMRCMNLARLGDIFICRDYDGNMGEYISEKGIKVFYIKKDIEAVSEAKECIEILSETGISTIFTDSYTIGNDFYRTIRNGGIKSIAMDDLAEINIDADMIVNHNPYAYEEMYSGKSNAEILAGTTYTMIRKEISHRAPETIIKRGIENILVTLGGSDPENITGRIAEKFDNTEFNVKLILGRSNKNIEILEKKYKESRNIAVCVNVSDMREQMEESDFIICAGGTTLWEVLYLGVPFGVVQIADNQKLSAEYVVKNSLGLFLGNQDNINVENIEKRIKEYSFEDRIKNSMRGRKIFDGAGEERIRAEVERYLGIK